MNPLLAALVAAGIITQQDADRISRSLDPEAARAWAERQIAVAMQSGLSDQQARLVDLIQRNNGNVTTGQLDDFWAAEDERLFAVVQPAIVEVATERAIGAAIRMGADDSMWNAINQAVIDWTTNYYTSPEPAFVGSIPNLDQTSREQVAEAFTRWNQGELNETGRGGLPALIAELEQTFDPVRAERIAVTETTRIFSEAEQRAADVDPDIEVKRWDTAFDDIVCPICQPLDNMVVDKDAPFASGLLLPPAHVNCRCGVTYLVRPGAAQAAAEKATQPSTQPPAEVATATPAPAAPRGPAGKPVSAIIDSSARIEDEFASGTNGAVDMTPAVTEMTGRIERVHGVGDAPPVGVMEMTSGQKDTLGFMGGYQPDVKRGRFDEAPAWKGGEILVDAQMQPVQVQATITHEFGHYLDNKAIGASGEYASVSDPLLDEWRKAVSETQGIKTLEAYRADRELAERETGIPSVLLPSEKTYQYLLDPREMWARSYMQYVSEKSGALEMIAAQDSQLVRTQWDTADFAPVARAIDNLFLKLGWLK